MSLDLQKELKNIDLISNADEKGKAYEAIATKVIEAQDTGMCKDFIRQIFEESVPAALSRAIVHEFAVNMKKLSNDAVLEIGKYMLELIGPRIVSMEEEDAMVREQMAESYAAKRNYPDAAKILSATLLENTYRSIKVDEKVAKYVQIAEYFLEADDPVSADAYISKAGYMTHMIESIALKLRYKVCHARISDSQRKFNRAAIEYHELTQQTELAVDEDDITKIIDCAVTCAILASSGPQKSRILTNLYKDERTKRVEGYYILEKMHQGRVIRKQETESFIKTLQPHHMSRYSDGDTALDRALLEHNIAVLSKIYKNISLEQLGTFLDIDADKAESLIANMASENRIQAVLDQVSRMVEFRTESRRATWDKQIVSVCNSINDLISEILQKHPNLAVHEA